MHSENLTREIWKPPKFQHHTVDLFSNRFGDFFNTGLILLPTVYTPKTYIYHLCELPVHSLDLGKDWVNHLANVLIFKNRL